MDERGTRDVTEFLNISKDDALAWPNPVHRTYPATVNARMESVVQPFVRKALTINHFLIDVLNDKLGLPKGTLAAFHQVQKHSGCIARVIRAPPYVGVDEKLFLTAHTDYGSLVSAIHSFVCEHLDSLEGTHIKSFLHNRLGGLQVLPPGSDKWYYVKVRLDRIATGAVALSCHLLFQPVPGLAICNVGDALNIFSGGILRSNIHRVMSALISFRMIGCLTQ